MKHYYCRVFNVPGPLVAPWDLPNPFHQMMETERGLDPENKVIKFHERLLFFLSSALQKKKTCHSQFKKKNSLRYQFVKSVGEQIKQLRCQYYPIKL